MSSGHRPVTPEFERFCACLNHYEVDFIVVGSEAVAFHGAPRFSADFDTWVLATRAILFRVMAALEAFGLPDVAREIDPEVWAKTRWFLSLDDLIRNKRAAGRPKDLADIAALEDTAGFRTDEP